MRLDDLGQSMTLESNKSQVDKQSVRKLATIAEASPQTAQHVVEAVKAAPTPKVAKQIIQEAARELPKPGLKGETPPPQPLEFAFTGRPMRPARPIWPHYQPSVWRVASDGWRWA